MTARGCRVCGGHRLLTFLERGSVPVLQNVPFPSEREARGVARGDVRLSFCEDCSFVANERFDPRLAAYGEGYENDQTCSAVFERHVDELVEGLVRDGVTGKRVSEIGCGSGRFLVRLCDRGANRGIGYDPAYRGPDSELGGAVTFVRDYYRGQAAATPEVVVSRHVIEHVPEPGEFLASIHDAFGGRPGLLCLETPALEWILDRVVVQDVFYEHCSYFSSVALDRCLARAGFGPLRRRSLFGGQYQWVEAAPLPAASAPTPDAAELARLRAAVTRYAGESARSLEALRTRLVALAARGPVALWGAGAKGVTVANLIDPDRALVACVVDVNPKKQGRFVAGTGHEIVSPRQLVERGARSVVAMNPLYGAEIAAELARVDDSIALEVLDTP